MDSTTCTLQCWVNGDDVDRIFTVDISPTKTVSNLKEIIKEKAPVNVVYANDLDLYAIPSPDDEDLDAVLTQWNPTGASKLNGRAKLSTLFLLVDHREPLIVIDGPSIGTTRYSVTLNCWVRGQEFRRTFPVEISSTELVGTLRNAIKDKKPVDFRHVDASKICLYKVCLPADDGIEETLGGLSLSEKDTLQPMETVSHYFPKAPPYHHVHIVVEAPLPISAELGSCSENVSFGSGISLQFQEAECRIEWTRPSARGLAIPITLLHSIFGEFVDDCHNREPTSGDNNLVLDLCLHMPWFFEDDRERQEAINNILRKHGVGILPSSFSHYTTDGELHVKGRRYVILEVKNEIGSKGAESYCQGIIYYVTGIKDEVKNALERDVQFNFPCLIITHFGSHLSFSGAVWANRPNYQVLSTSLPLFTPPTDRMMRKSLGRHIGAFRKACGTLKKLYEEFAANPAAFRDLQPEYPYPRSYIGSDGKEVKFKYITALGDCKLLFLVETTDTREQICVKFAHSYSVDAHRHCADLGISPPLEAYSVIPGVWHMIVMAFLRGHQCLNDAKDGYPREDKERLRRELESKLTLLHQKGFVHGDMRDANVMVAKDRTGWKLIDFDWSGKIGEVRYPMNVNRKDMRRPDGAIDGELILADHDIQMLDYFF